MKVSGETIDEGAVRAFELYYDSTAIEPKEDPEILGERLAALAERDGIEYRAIDTKDYTNAERADLSRELRAAVTDEDHDTGPRVFAGRMFARSKPVLVVRYAEGSADLFPHRDDVESSLPVSIRAFLDAFEGVPDGPGPRRRRSRR